MPFTGFILIAHNIFQPFKPFMAMFQRQTRQSFPARNIIILGAAVIGMFYFLAKNLRENAVSQPTPSESEEKKDSTLTPSEWFHVLREYPTFKTDINTYTNALNAARTGVQDRSAYPGFSTPWTVQGPGNIGARVNTIKVHPTNPDIIYIGYSGGGVWKTTNGGASWAPIFDQQSFLAVGDIELDPQNPEIVYIGTGDPNISSYPFIGDGLWKSTNGGQSWQNIGLGAQRIISKIVTHPNNSNILYVATMGLPFERNNQRGLYKTTNGGQSWEQVLFVSDQSGAIDLEMSPSNPNVLYVAFWDRIRNNQESLVSGPASKIWKTTDGGSNWNMLSGGLPEDDQCRIGFDIDRNNANHLIATYAGTNLMFKAMYESFDGGQSWEELLTNGLDPNFQRSFAWYFCKTFINPYNSDQVFNLGVELWRSDDGSENWLQSTPDWWEYIVHADMHDMAFISANTYLLATDGGLYKTTDNAESWTKIENIPTTQLYRVAYNPHNPAWYYGGAQDNGTFGGDQSSITEWPRLYGGDGFQAAFHPEDPNIYYYETQNGGIACTIDGLDFVSGTEGLDDNDRRNWDMQYIISPNDPEFMYTGTFRVYQSFGHPAFWAPISEDLTDGIIFGARYHTITTLHESPLDPSTLLVGTSDGNVWVGDPFSQTWNNISAGLPDRYVSSVKASTTNANRVFVSHTGYKSNDFTPHIHRSDDRGANWVGISGDLPNIAVNDLLILPGHQDSVIFAATDAGVYGTLDGGGHWERLGTGMPMVAVYDIEFNFEQQTLFAGSHARSIFSFPLDSLQFGNNVSTYAPNGSQPAIMRVTPSLVTDRTTLVIDHLKSKQRADVFITDMQGKLMWQNSCKGYGRHEFPLELSTWPAGVYIAFSRSDSKVWGQQKFVVGGR
jgi:photosystem II stability/assembly factor-like uncharacterized protein